MPRFAATLLMLLFFLPLAAGAAPVDDPDQALAVLTRLGFGPTAGDVARVAAMGVPRYLDQQLHPERTPVPALLQQQLAALTTLHETPQQLFLAFRQTKMEGKVDKAAGDMGDKKMMKVQLNEPLREAREAKLLRAIESPNQLEEMLVDFWYNHFNVYGEKEIDRVFIADYENKAIRPFVFDHFRDMLEATAKSPAMLYYLDQWKNVAPVTGQPTVAPNGKKDAEGINENYAREVMELHTLGVDGGYTQKDVTELARILTGWGYGAAKARQAGRQLDPQQVQAENHGVFYFDPAHHDNGTKLFLNHVFQPAGQAEGEAALDMLASSPITAKHVSYELAQYFVADQPPPALVQRMAATWQRTKGDLRAVTRTMIESPELLDPQYRGTKYRTPFQYVAAAVRASGAPVDTDVLLAMLKKMGELPYDCLTPDGYKSTADAWLDSSATATRLNFATALGTGKLQQVHVDRAADGTPDKQVDGGLATPLDAAKIEAAMNNEFSPNSLQAIAAAGPNLQAALVLGSPEMMRR